MPTGAPSFRIVPESGWWAPEMILIKVDLPLPFSPRRPWISSAEQCNRYIVVRHDAGKGLGDVAQLPKRNLAWHMARCPRSGPRGAFRGPVVSCLVGLRRLGIEQIRLFKNLVGVVMRD